MAAAAIRYSAKMASLMGTVGYIEDVLLAVLNSCCISDVASRLWFACRVVAFELYAMADDAFSSSGPAAGAGWTSGGFGGAVSGA